MSLPEPPSGATSWLSHRLTHQHLNASSTSASSPRCWQCEAEGYAKIEIQEAVAAAERRGIEKALKIVQVERDQIAKLTAEREKQEALYDEDILRLQKERDEAREALRVLVNLDWKNVVRAQGPVEYAAFCAALRAAEEVLP